MIAGPARFAPAREPPCPDGPAAGAALLAAL